MKREYDEVHLSSPMTVDSCSSHLQTRLRFCVKALPVFEALDRSGATLDHRYNASYDTSPMTLPPKLGVLGLDTLDFGKRCAVERELLVSA